jgi:hypothetical protein
MRRRIRFNESFVGFNFREGVDASANSHGQVVKISGHCWRLPVQSPERGPLRKQKGRGELNRTDLPRSPSTAASTSVVTGKAKPA